MELTRRYLLQDPPGRALLREIEKRTNQAPKRDRGVKASFFGVPTLDF